MSADMAAGADGSAGERQRLFSKAKESGTAHSPKRRGSLGWSAGPPRDKVTGSRTVRAPNYTEHALGGTARARIQSYDSATALGLPRIVSNRVRLESWEFPGWGSHFRMEAPVDLNPEGADSHKGAPKLGEWAATAICGNDILSSVLYVSGLVTMSAGILAPVCLLCVAGILYLYRFIYGEAISALPANGGSYNVLINTTSKAVASFAACLAVISYIATGVVSAATAIAYLQELAPQVDLVWGTIALLFFFACLVAMGISDSATVALGMFVMHVFTLGALCVACGVYAVFNTATLTSNVAKPYPDVTLGGNVVPGTFWTALLFGVCVGMLGVSGFESSSQFVEEQKDGVFVKTLRNMWIGVAVFNPVICLLSFCVLNIDEIIASQHFMLAAMAQRVGHWASGLVGIGSWDTPSLGYYFKCWVSADAFIVLSGAVLTAYVGISGLIRRMARDRCLPQFLLNTNKWRGTNHNIIFGFFVLSASQCLLLHGDINVLAGVYSFAFLGVMSIFSVGCVLLKFKRPSLPRDVTVSYSTVFVGLACVLTAFVGNMMSKPEILSYFALYFLIVGAVVLCVFQRIRILRMAIYLVGGCCSDPARKLKEQITEIQNVPYIFFCKSDDAYTVNKAILYVRDNEQTSRLLVVHVSEDPESPVIKNLSKLIELIGPMYPKTKISLLTIKGYFSPGLIEWLSRDLQIPTNMMFITCIDSVFRYKIQSLGGVRVITH